MTKEEIQKKQDELDNEEMVCPECGNLMNWGWYREWGSCGDCVEKHMKEYNNKSKNKQNGK